MEGDVFLLLLLGYAAVDAICNYYEQLPQKPVKAEVEPGYLLEKLPCA